MQSSNPFDWGSFAYSLVAKHVENVYSRRVFIEK